ncbi:MAG: leucine-rich repeat domain-containing protein [Fidelibacterota bacterium]|nr:MAG: leucine-rich repeat domain-containing protein [Candidatus Neomarinimicrobiota bacterium]
MRRNTSRLFLLILTSALALPQLARAQYEIPVSVVGGGGGASTGGSYSLSGTVGQAAADEGLTGGSYGHDAGFWPAAQVLTAAADGLTGTYVIGPDVGDDYPDFTAAVSDLIANGVSGKVTFQVKQGTYKERISIPLISGVSATNTITFEPHPDNTTPAILAPDPATGAADNYIVQLDAAQYVTFQGLEFTAGFSSYSRVFDLLSAVAHIQLLNNTLNGIAGGGDVDQAVIAVGASAGNIPDDLVIRGNTINYGGYGIWASGVSGQPMTNVQIDSNTVTGHLDQGIYVAYADAPSISYNTVKPANSATAAYWGIYVLWSINKIQIIGNQVDAVNGGGAIQIDRSGGNVTPGYWAVLANNLVHSGGGDVWSQGIKLHSMQQPYSYWEVYHNTAHVTGTSGTSGRAFWHGGAPDDNSVIIKNNIFANTGGGYACVFYDPANDIAVGDADYNDIYSTGSDLINVGGTSYTLADYQTTFGHEAKSISADPAFVSPKPGGYDYQLHPGSPAIGAGDVGIIAAPLDFDIKGNPRPDPGGTNPDLGAYEHSLGTPGTFAVSAADSLALVALYNATGGGGWNNTWDLDAQVYTWHGVTIDGGRVTSLNLLTNNLSGSIPAQIGDLTGLQALNLSLNNLNGEIPAEIGNLTNLGYLNLEANSLTGEIPDGIGNLVNLGELRLERNQLTGNIPAGIGSLTSLTVLRLYSNQLTGLIPAQIGGLTSLTVLRLNSNQLTGDIPPEIGNLTSLTVLYLHDNQLTGSIPGQIGNLSGLTELFLYSNQLTGNIPAEIGNLTSLTNLNLWHNQLTGPIPDALQNLTSLTRLDLDDNQLTGSIPAWIGNLINLEVMYIGGNPFSGEVPGEIGTLPNLHTLGINTFQLPPGATRPGWNNLDNITSIYLYGRMANDVIPDWVGTLTQLTKFYLVDHQLPGGIPDWVSNFTGLTALYIRRNELGAPIPAWIGNLTGLEYLYLNDNQLSGAVPAGIANLSQVRALFLYNNQLDVLPDLSGGSLSSLQWLRVQDNRFTFEDIVPNVGLASEEFTYAPQDSVGLEKDTTVTAGSSLSLQVLVGGTGNQYQWLKDGDPIGATSNTLNTAAVTPGDAGSYVLRITNPGASDLTLHSRPVNVTVVAPPTATTRPPTNVTSTSAVIKGLVNPNGFSTAVSFDWGTTMSYGQVSTAEQSPVTGTEAVAVSVPIDNLTAGITYHYRVRAQSSSGTTLGDDQAFTTPADENTTVDNRVIPGSGPIRFWNTSLFMNFNFTNQTGEDIIRVSRVETGPTGTLPSTVGLVASRYWIIEHFGTSTFGVAVTFVLGPGVIGAEDQATPGNLWLLRRNTGSEDPWADFARGTSATDSSVTFTNITGFSEFTIGSTSLAVDTEAPSIASVSVAPQVPVGAGNDVIVTASISDDRGVQDVFLHYGAGGASLSPTGMGDVGGGVYADTIPGSEVTFKGIVFFVRAADAAGNADTSDYQFVPVQFNQGDLTTGISGSDFSGGFPMDRWRLISVPGAPDNASVGTIIEDALDASTDTTWRLYEYTRDTGNPWRQFSTFAPGASYWLYQQVGSGIHFDAGTGKTDNLSGFDITIKPGWNLVGTPFPFKSSISLDQGTYYGPITFTGSDTALTGWTGIRSELVPWGGYAVYNRTGDDQTVTLSAEPGLVVSKDLLAKGIADQPDGWLLQLRAEGKTYADVANTVGRLAGATEQLDYFDNPEPPYIGGFISLAMERDDWGANLPRFTSDIRSIEENDGIWDLELFVKGEKGPITLSPDLQGDLPPGNRIILLDVMTREVHDLLTDHRQLVLTRYREDFPYHLKVVAGSASFVEYTTDEILASLPSDFSLAQNYPNPFNPATTLRYSLFQPARVTLKVYNLLGQEVVTLVDGWQDLGHYEAVWEGRDRFGVQVASGIYFAVYMAEGRLFTRKMVLMK